MSEALVCFLPWLLLATILLFLAALVKYNHRTGKVFGLLGAVSLLALIVVYRLTDVSWRLLPTLFVGYRYEPAIRAPDAHLIPHRPEVIVDRQLAALIGKTGPSPLQADTPLQDYAIDAVEIADWTRRWPTANVEVTLTFADGTTEQHTLALESRGGHYLYLPPLGEIPVSAADWYAPESSLAPLLQAPAPGTPVRTDAAPVTLSLVTEVDTTVLQGVEPNTSFAVVSDISTSGDMLLDVDLRKDEAHTGSALLLHRIDGTTTTLTETFVSARGVFAPDGESIAYVRSTEAGRPLRLVVRAPDGSEQVVSSVDWMTQHWASNSLLAYSYHERAYLYDLPRQDATPMADLMPEDRIGSRFFLVSPLGDRVAYVDFDGRLWVKELASGNQQQIGWDVSDLSWGAGMAWSPDGTQLVYTTSNNVTLPNQQEVWVWDTVSGRSTLLARTGVEFIPVASGTTVRLGGACWAGNDTVVFAAHNLEYSNEAVYLFAARADGRGLWSITPPELHIPFGEIRCANGYIAVNPSRTIVYLYRIEPGTYYEG